MKEKDLVNLVYIYNSLSWLFCMNNEEMKSISITTNCSVEELIKQLKEIRGIKDDK